MFKVPLVNLPNQSIALNVDGAYWQLHISQATSYMYAAVTRDGIELIRGVRCLGGFGLMPYRHMYEPNFGNFVFDGDADWTRFNIDINLFYMTNSEWSEYQSLIGS